MEQKRNRGRPPKPKETGWLLAEKQNEGKTQAEVDKFLLRFMNRISNKGSLTMSDFKYIYKPRSKAMLDIKKYGLSWGDAVIQQLKRQCKKPPSIGILSLTELECCCGMLPQGGDIESKLLDGMEYMTASLIYSNPKYIDKVTENYWQYDLNSAYAYQLVENRMPSTLKKIVEGRYYSEADEVSVYVDKVGNATFDFYDTNINITKTYVYNTIAYGIEFAEKWFELKQNPKYKKLAKDVIVCAIGAIHKYRRNLVARYVWYKQKKFMLEMMSHCERRGCEVVKVHTDGIGYIGSEALFIDSNRLGEFKLEHQNKRIYMIGAGQYQIEGSKPRLSGINWGGTWIEKNNGERTHYSIFPCIKRNDMIKSYEKDGVEYKTLGADIGFKKGEE